jgi:hypothetical protein
VVPIDETARLVAMTNETNGGRNVRLRQWYGKLAYVVVAAILVYLATAIPLGAGGGGILRSVLAFVLVLLGARIFRGAGEEVAPARAWWRMTAAVPSGILLGSLCTVIAVVSAIGYVGLTVANLPHKDVTDLPALLVTAVLSAILAYLYFGSSRRLVIARRQQGIAHLTTPSRRLL